MCSNLLTQQLPPNPTELAGPLLSSFNMSFNYTHPLSPGSLTPQSGRSMLVTNHFACHHCSDSIVPLDEDVSTTRVLAEPCESAACQAIPQEYLWRTSAEMTAESRLMIRQMNEQLTLAGMDAESALRTMHQAEPMLPNELQEQGCSPSLVRALLCSRPGIRSAAANTYLGHRRALALLEELKTCYRIGAPDWAARMLSLDLAAANEDIQQKLVTLQRAVFRLTENFYSAPAAPFHRDEGIRSFQKHWGKRELKLLRMSAQGNVVLLQPLTDRNILLAKMRISSTEQRLQLRRDLMCAKFFADNPDLDGLDTPGIRELYEEFLMDQFDDSDSYGESEFSDDLYSPVRSPLDYFKGIGRDIRELRPQHRVASKKMSSNKLTILT